jgi:PPOX class probable F420-dependent enzyme
MPVWFVFDGEELVFTTWGDSVKRRNLRRDPRAAVIVDEEIAPYAFVHIRGPVALSEGLEELLRFATAIAGRYMGARRAEGFGRRNAVPASCWCDSDRSVSSRRGTSPANQRPVRPNRRLTDRRHSGPRPQPVA